MIPEPKTKLADDNPLLWELKMTIAVLARTNQTPLQNTFPGMQPISLSRTELKTLNDDFVVCEKTDGVRFLMLTWKYKLYLVDRKFDFYPVEVKWPSIQATLPDSVNSTLLDGELVVETSGPNVGRSVFYVFDAICVRTHYVGDLCLLDRLRVACSDFLVKMPRDTSASQIDFYLKKMYAAKDTMYVLDEVIPHMLTHGNDGLIFTRNNAVYKPGTSPTVIKWKPSELNSVDFCLETLAAMNSAGTRESRYGVLKCASSGSLEYYGLIWLDEAQHRELAKEYFPRPIIIECVWDKKWSSMPQPLPNSWDECVPVRKGGWRMIKVRLDKDTANDKHVVERVLKSIKDDLNRADLKAQLLLAGKAI